VTDQPSSRAGYLAQHNLAGRHVCVGLDTVASRLPPTLLPGRPAPDRFVAFNAAIVEATADIVCAYKPNIAFYEALGPPGFETLARTIREIRRLAPDLPVIIDAKRADIGSTNDGYVTALFDELGADGVTVHPYLGSEALAPFLERTDRLIFVLTRTSNPGAGEFQDLLIDGAPLFEHVAHHVATSWNQHGNCGLVVGATYPEELRRLRETANVEMPFLIPGVGAQGGDLDAVVDAHRAVGSRQMIINASRSIIFASSGPDFAEAARREASLLHEQITQRIRTQSADSSG
jgi:orotidine-5'-phosphate decarboxylase